MEIINKCLILHPKVALNECLMKGRHIWRVKTQIDKSTQSAFALQGFLTTAKKHFHYRVLFFKTHYTRSTTCYLSPNAFFFALKYNTHLVNPISKTILQKSHKKRQTFTLFVPTVNIPNCFFFLLFYIIKKNHKVTTDIMLQSK